MTQEPGCDQGFAVVREQFIPGELFAEEAVIRFVGVERLNHVIAVSPRMGAGVVGLEAIGFGVTHDIEPEEGGSFAESR